MATVMQYFFARAARNPGSRRDLVLLLFNKTQQVFI
jgi:hypothetical protein